MHPQTTPTKSAPHHGDLAGAPDLRSSLTQLRLRALRCSAPNHHLGHLAVQSLAAPTHAACPAAAR